MQTLQELTPCFQLYAVCEPCQRVIHMELSDLIEREGADCPLDRIRLRLWCTTCRTRTRALRIVYVGEGGKASGFRYARPSQT